MSVIPRIRIFRIRILLGAVVLLTTTSIATGQKIPPQKPKLIVGITISGMQYDYLSVYWDKFGVGGFKKMATTGAYCKNARYRYLITDPSAGYASIASGARPSAHGIVADYWYNRVSNEIIYAISDPSRTTIEGSFGAGPYSPVSLHSRTLADELMVKSRFRSRSIGISMDPKAAVLMSGHTATGAYWLDPEHATWTTSSYYCDSLPGWVRDFNQKNYRDIYLERSWETLLPISEYTESMLDNNEYETGFDGQITFPYDLDNLSQKGKDGRDYSLLMTTPWGNTFTKDLAIAAIVSEGLGKRDVTDMIHVGFNATHYLADRFTTWSVEMEDTYLRMDQDLTHLLEFLENEIGLENVLIYLTAENALAVDPRYLADYRIPAGYFNYRTSISLLRSYLNAVYGQGDWVTFYHAHQIYLNHQLIEDSGLTLEEVQNRVARFMVQMGGVSNAIQSHVLQQNYFTDGVLNRVQNSYYQKRSGDVVIYLTPGWVEHSNLVDNSFAEFKYAPHVPLIFYGWKVKRTTIPYRVSPTDIATTIASFMEISMPDNATGVVIQDIIK
ncbi:MAG: alkaline phosphatase family protein [Bacteroidetes bacterium]|nr:alkaline phosphatase family protein [Bacteroidota bacterium]